MDAVGNIHISIVDGARKPLAKSRSVLVRVLDGRKRAAVNQWVKGSDVLIKDVRVFDNLDDLYTVIVHADGYEEAGVYPVKVRAKATVEAAVMLARQDAEFHFQPYKTLAARRPAIARMVDSERYSGLMEHRPRELGALLTIATAIEGLALPGGGTPLDSRWQPEWDLLAADRFWAWTDARLADGIEELAKLGGFAAEPDAGKWHPGIKGVIKPATRSWKQTRFDVANVQLSFHEKDRKQVEGVDCVIVEPDMDYYKDILAHGLLEVMPNRLTGGKTDPRMIYRLRWMAQRQEGLPDFEPPCTLE
jgi:hypothetical protein